MAEPYPVTKHSQEEDNAWTTTSWDAYGPPGVLHIVPELKPSKIFEEARQLEGRFELRQKAFQRWDSIAAQSDTNRSPGIESMVTNDARTMLGLAVFLVGSTTMRRTVAVGTQGLVAEHRSGQSERALAAWWNYVDTHRLLSGEGTFQNDFAYWACLYGWYSVRYECSKGDDGEFVPVAVPMNPMECFPQYATGEGLDRFVQVRDLDIADLWRMAARYGVDIGKVSKRTRLVDWWWRTPGGEIVHAMVYNGQRGYQWLLEPDKVEGLTEIPVVIGKCKGRPGAMEDTGSVYWDNERVYRDFDRYLSFFMTLVRQNAQAPVLAKRMSDITDKDVRPEDITMSGAILHSDDPEAEMHRLDVGHSTIEVQNFLGLIDQMLQRGGFPYLVYGGLGRELSGFAISQLLQAAEHRIGAQLQRLSFIDSIVGKRWLTAFRDGDFNAETLMGSEENNPRKSFVEEFQKTHVPKKFNVVTEVPLRIGNDAMAKMAIARQALGAVEQVLDRRTVLDEILQMQDPTAVMDRIDQDKARALSLPLRVALKLKLEALDVRASGQAGAEQAAQMLEAMAERALMQDQQARGAVSTARMAPGEMPPEMAGVSPDVIRAAGAPEVPNVRR